MYAQEQFGYRLLGGSSLGTCSDPRFARRPTSAAWARFLEMDLKILLRGPVVERRRGPKNE